MLKAGSADGKQSSPALGFRKREAAYRFFNILGDAFRNDRWPLRGNDDPAQVEAGGNDGCQQGADRKNLPEQLGVEIHSLHHILSLRYTPPLCIVCAKPLSALVVSGSATTGLAANRSWLVLHHQSAGDQVVQALLAFSECHHDVNQRRQCEAQDKLGEESTRRAAKGDPIAGQDELVSSAS